MVTLGLLAVTWGVAELLLEGPQEAREDMEEHVTAGLLWVVPTLIWFGLRRPRSRWQAFGVAVGLIIIASSVNLLFLFRFLAEDFGLPIQVSAVLVAGLSLFLVLYQTILALIPAAILQVIVLRRAVYNRRMAEISEASLSGSTAS